MFSSGHGLKDLWDLDLLLHPHQKLSSVNKKALTITSSHKQSEDKLIIQLNSVVNTFTKAGQLSKAATRLEGKLKVVRFSQAIIKAIKDKTPSKLLTPFLVPELVNLPLYKISKEHLIEAARTCSKRSKPGEDGFKSDWYYDLFAGKTQTLISLIDWITLQI